MTAIRKSQSWRRFRRKLHLLFIDHTSIIVISHLLLTAVTDLIKGVS